MAGIGDLLDALKGGITGTTEIAKYGALDYTGTEKIIKAYVSLGGAVSNLSDVTSDLTLAGGNLLAVNKNLVDSYDGLNKQIAALELRNKDINTTFGINSKAAAKLSTTYQKMANAFKVFSGEQAIVYGNSIRKMLPMYKQEGKADDTKMKNLMAIQHVLTTNMGLTEEDAANYTMYASKAGENAASLMEVAKSAAALAGDTDGSLGYMKMITEGIATAGADIQLQYGRLGGNLEIAVLKANKLGFELEDLASTGDQLLNIESSIGDELEYQLLSGRRLVDQRSGKSLTNMFREATLMGDMSKQADALNTILEQEGDTLENNLFARKQMSQLLGMDEASLARALQKKKLLEKEGLTTLMNLDGSELQSAAEAMMKNGEITEDTYKEIAGIADTRTSDEIAKAQYDLAAENVEQMKELLGVNQTNNVQLTRQTMLQEDMNGILINAFPVERGKAIRNMQAFGYIQEAPAELATRAGGKSVKDVVIPPGGSAPIISAPAGTFILDPQDTIMAGTNLLPNGSAPTGGNGDNLAAIMLQVGRMIVAAINDKGSNIFGATSMNSGYYQGTA
jgi:hypothetical protein